MSKNLRKIGELNQSHWGEEYDMQHQGLKMEVCLICLKICKEACVVGAE